MTKWHKAQFRNMRSRQHVKQTVETSIKWAWLSLVAKLTWCHSSIVSNRTNQKHSDTSLTEVDSNLYSTKSHGLMQQKKVYAADRYL